MPEDKVPPGRYRHFKGRDYLVLGVARHSETKDPLVVYHPIEDPADLWVRPVEMWSEQVTCGERSSPRFRPLDPEAHSLDG
jgi:hypothetical protein